MFIAGIARALALINNRYKVFELRVDMCMPYYLTIAELQKVY